jgi:hypothetical protein
MKLMHIPQALLVAFALAAVAAPSPRQIDAKPLVAEKIKKDGRYQFQQDGQYSAFVDVNNGKVRAVKVSHPGFGGVPVKKYKSAARVGYAYADEKGAQVIYWFPAEMVEDLKGAVEYAPAS